MKARVKYNNEIIDVIQVGTKSHLYDLNNVEFLDNPQDYWTRLEHQYAGMAMQGILSNANHALWDRENNAEGIAKSASAIAHALVEKYKKEEQYGNNRRKGKRSRGTMSV